MNVAAVETYCLNMNTVQHLAWASSCIVQCSCLNS